jgi:hypothetical protein
MLGKEHAEANLRIRLLANTRRGNHTRGHRLDREDRLLERCRSLREALRRTADHGASSAARSIV